MELSQVWLNQSVNSKREASRMNEGKMADSLTGGLPVRPADPGIAVMAT